MENTRVCTVCKIERNLDQYISKAGRTNLKNCLRCRTIKNQSLKKCEHGRRKTRCKECGGGSICEHGKQKTQCKECGGSQICEHGRRKTRCKECGGGSICEHGKQKTQCKECGGSQICEHGKQKSICKDCGGSQICEHNRQKSTCKICSNPKKITIKNMICGSKQKDIKYNRYDANNFIDKFFVEMLMDESMSCYYCKKILQLVTYDDSLCTIERLDNNIGHTKANCVLACRKCNLSRVGEK